MATLLPEFYCQTDVMGQCSTVRFKPQKRAILFCLFTAFASLGILSYSDGPARSNLTVTGAPFNGGQTCAVCHQGGLYGSAVNTYLIDTATGQATRYYTPGKTYLFLIRITETTGTKKFGFQTSVSTNGFQQDIDNWRRLPDGIHKIFTGGRTYVEHNRRLDKGIIRLLWKAPSAGTGDVTFYTAANVVNYNFNSSGDEVVNTSLPVKEQRNNLFTMFP